MHNFVFMRSKLARAVLAVAIIGSLGFAGCRQVRVGAGGAGSAGQAPNDAVGAKADTQSFTSRSMRSTLAVRMRGAHAGGPQLFAGSRSVAPPDTTAYLQTGLYGQHWENGLDTRESVQGDFGAKPEQQLQPQEQQPPADQQKQP